jgi:GNAT superfamily N-acetyltransferase
MIIRPIEPRDKAAWAALHRAFVTRGFMTRGQDSATESAWVECVLDNAWGRLLDPGNVLEGLVAEEGGALIALVHYRACPSPNLVKDMGFIDSLFVAPAARGRGVGAALIEEVSRIARARGWAMVRWVTHTDNAVARAFYDRIAGKPIHVAYDIDIAQGA